MGSARPGSAWAIDDPAIRARERFSNLYERACRQSAGGDDWITTLSVAGGLVQPLSADAHARMVREAAQPAANT